MVDIFLSYAPEDHDIASELGLLLERAGFSVWHDSPSTLAAESADPHLVASRIALILLSEHSTPNGLALETAKAAGWPGAKIPVLIRAVDLPLPWRNLHCMDLTHWNGSASSPDFRSLVTYLQRLVASTAPYAEEIARPAPSAGLWERIAGAVNSFVRRTPSRAIEASIEPPSAPATAPAHEPLPASGPPPAEPAPQPIHLPRSKPPASAADALSDPVLMGIAAPRESAPGQSFTASFAAYIEAARESVQRKLSDLGEEGDRVVLDLTPDREPRWRIGAPVTVRVTGEHLQAQPAERSFEWNGRENLASFAVRVADDAPQGTTVLAFHVELGPLPIAYVPVRLRIGAPAPVAEPQRIEVRSPSSAFASYSSQDGELVARSLSALAHWAPRLDIFQDCLDLTPNETFKPQLAAEIAKRDVFLLFWSRHACASPWVNWEYQTARAEKGLDAILPMPLEDPAIVQPPPEFADRHLRDRFMIAGYGLAAIKKQAADAQPGK
jgi:hypothetical protein